MRLWAALVLTWALIVPGEAPSVRGALGIASKVLSIVNGVTGIASDLSSDDTSELLHKFDVLTARMARLERDVRSVSLGPLRNFDAKLGAQLRWSGTLDTLEQLLRNVYSKYDRFLLYQRQNVTVERWTLEDFAREAVSHSPDSVQSTLYSLRDLALGGGLRSPHLRQTYTAKSGLFRKLKSVLKGSKAMVCGLEQSPQQLGYNLLVVLLVALGKINYMVHFSYIVLRALGKGQFTSEEEHFSADSRRIVDAILKGSARDIRGLTPVFWRCDPARHERGVTYEEVTELLQGHVENEADLSTINSCTGACSDYKSDHTNRCYAADRWEMPCERQRRCAGTLHQCRYIAFSATACLADTERQPHRRYGWLEYDSGRMLGRKDSVVSCASKLSMSSWIRGFVRCSSCFCLCDDDTHSERYFSLLPSLSDIDDNKVVSGVRFVKKDRVFYIQVEQGVADKVGYIKQSTEEWKPINRSININRDTEGGDFLRLSFWKRSVLLRDVRGPPGHAITGVSFDTSADGMSLSLKIRVTAISADGMLAANSSVWVSGGGVPAGRLELGPEPELPTEPGAACLPDSQPGQTVKFSASSAAQDAAQTTLPLLDVQPVAPRPASWLAGVGLFHKGRPGSGGFLGLRVFQPTHAG